MDYNLLLDLAIDLGYELSMSGAETFRVEESVSRIIAAYGIDCDVFAIPNYIMITIRTADRTPITRMRRIGHHGSDLDTVERFSGLSRAICNRKPELQEAHTWLKQVRETKRSYPMPIQFLGDFLGSAGFCLFFGGNWMDSICSGFCGMLVGFVNKHLDDMKANQFFRTIASSFLMALLAYALGALGISQNPDAVTIGALMILVPGLLFTNAMRDIIYGDTNSGINRIVQVFLVAAAIALGTASAWSLASLLWGEPISLPGIDYSLLSMCLFCFIGCVGFAILFNIHGPGGLLCALGGVLAWAVYCLALKIGGNDIIAFFWGALVASAYSEIMARIRKCPAISYLVISIFPLIPGAGVYYTMNYAVRGNMELFASQGMHTATIAGIMAVGILLASTCVRIYTVWKIKRHK